MLDQQTQARNRTARQVEALNREILRAYDEALSTITTRLEATYARALSGVAPEDYYNIMTQYGRLETLQKRIADEYVAVSRRVGTQIRESSRLAMANSYYQQQYVLDFFSPNANIVLDFAILPDALLEASTLGTLDLWNDLTPARRTAIGDQFGAITGYLRNDGSLSEVILKNRRDELLRISRTINSAMVTGQPYAATARSIRRVINISKNSAARIVRTEGNRNLNAGAFANSQQAEAQGLPIKRQWVATLDDRTRDSHASLDGVQVAVNEPFQLGSDRAMYPGDFADPANSINCRCTVIDAVDGIPPQIRSDGYGNTFEWRKYNEWAKANNMRQLPNGRWMAGSRPPTGPTPTGGGSPRISAPTGQTNIPGRFDLFRVSQAARANLEGIARSRGVSLQTVVNAANEYSNRYPGRVINIQTIEGLV